MNWKKLVPRITILAIFFLVACGGQNGSMSTQSVTETATQVPATITLTLTPSLVPTSTPTFSPTPLGGRNGVLFYNSMCVLVSSVKANCSHYIYLYDMNSKQVNKLFEGYILQGVSPDGRKIILNKENIEKRKTDLYTVDLAKPEEIVLLYEDVDFNSTWFPGTNWIGFIAKKDGIPQVFIIHPDGSGLTQVTESSIGAVTIEMDSTYTDGFAWTEGTSTGNSIQMINRYWIALDDRGATAGVGPEEITLTKPNPEMTDWNFQYGRLSEHRLLVRSYDDTMPSRYRYYIYAAEGKPLLAISELPHNHDPLADETDISDYYDIIGGYSGALQMEHVPASPDGDLLLLQHVISDSKGSNTNYYVLNLSTFAIEQLPNLQCTYKKRGDVLEGLCGIEDYYWVEIP